MIAAKLELDKLKDFLGLDSLHYLSIEGMLEASGVESPENHFCKACFDGDYPVKIDKDMAKNCLEC